MIALSPAVHAEMAALMKASAKPVGVTGHANAKPTPGADFNVISAIVPVVFFANHIGVLITAGEGDAK